MLCVQDAFTIYVTFAFANEAEGTLIDIMLFLTGVAEWNCRWAMDSCVFFAADVADVFIAHLLKVAASTNRALVHAYVFVVISSAY